MRIMVHQTPVRDGLSHPCTVEYSDIGQVKHCRGGLLWEALSEGLVEKRGLDVCLNTLP